jgi:hypothetical protein
MLSFECVALTPFSYPDDIKRTSLVRQAGTPIKTPPTRTLARNGLVGSVVHCTARIVPHPDAGVATRPRSGQLRVGLMWARGVRNRYRAGFDSVRERNPAA